jgi:multidrug efflux pump subunit AcrA (membrane-fusion protein)
MRRSIFRQVALERLSSPEQLDQLMPVTRPRGWLALLALVGLIVTVLAWSFSDTIPTQVLGRGILIRGGQLAPVVAPSAGQVTEILAHPGDTVAQGQTLALIASAEGAAPRALTSPVAGRIVDLDAVLGGVVETGATIASVEDLGKPLEAVIYMPASTGANVRPGMEVQVSPSSLSREQYGFIRGTVRSVASFPSTFQSMMRVLANEQLVREFLEAGTPVEVRIDLAPDPATPSGYRWSSSSGPPFAIDSGALCQATITLEEQRPINLVFPNR